ncbi:hypothetical protein K435DRAFT_707066, partial [Dendrothele bispora CBS 962.96]
DPTEPPQVLFNLASQGYKLPPPPRDDGSDVEMHSISDNDGEGIDVKLTHLWRQFILDVTAKSPNMKKATAPSYLKLSPDDRAKITDALYKDMNFGELFVSCRYKYAGRDEFEKAFNYFFTPPGTLVAEGIQNYTNCKYWPKWQEYSAGPKTTSKAMHSALRELFMSLDWIPQAASDKMWNTSTKNTRDFTVLPVGHQGPAPRLLVRKTPIW